MRKHGPASVNGIREKKGEKEVMKIMKTLKANIILSK